MKSLTGFKVLMEYLNLDYKTLATKLNLLNNSNINFVIEPDWLEKAIDSGDINENILKALEIVTNVPVEYYKNKTLAQKYIKQLELQEEPTRYTYNQDLSKPLSILELDVFDEDSQKHTLEIQVPSTLSPKTVDEILYSYADDNARICVQKHQIDLLKETIQHEMYQVNENTSAHIVDTSTVQAFYKQISNDSAKQLDDMAKQFSEELYSKIRICSMLYDKLVEYGITNPVKLNAVLPIIFNFYNTKYEQEVKDNLDDIFSEYIENRKQDLKQKFTSDTNEDNNKDNKTK